MPRYRSNVCSVQNHRVGQRALNPERVIVRGRYLAVGIQSVKRRRRQQRAGRIDVFHETEIQGWRYGFRWISNHVEDSISLITIVESSTADAEDKIVASGNVPGQTETRSPYRRWIGHQIFVV